ncbi:hypothetical protein D3C85_1814910 [compost metagenome]
MLATAPALAPADPFNVASSANSCTIDCCGNGVAVAWEYINQFGLLTVAPPSTVTFNGPLPRMAT